MMKLKLQYFGHLIRTDSLEKTLMLGKIAISHEVMGPDAMIFIF